MSKKAAKDLLSRYKVNGECWEWTGAVNPDGYGNTKLSGVAMSAHRAAWILRHGAIPPGKCVLHRCDNRCCIRDEHHFLGTHLDNMRDMVGKRRHNHILTDEDILAIQSDKRPHRYIAEQYGIAERTVRFWKGRPLPAPPEQESNPKGE